MRLVQLVVRLVDRAQQRERPAEPLAAVHERRQRAHVGHAGRAACRAGTTPGGSHTAAHATLPSACATQISPNGAASLTPALMNAISAFCCCTRFGTKKPNSGSSKNARASAADHRRVFVRLETVDGRKRPWSDTNRRRSLSVVPDAVALDSIGWNEHVADAVAAAQKEHPDTTPGRVSRVDRGVVTVFTADGPVRAATRRGAARDRRLGARRQRGRAGRRDRAPAPVGVRPRRPHGRLGAQCASGRRQRRHGLRHPVARQRPNMRRLERELVLAFESGAGPGHRADQGRPRRRGGRHCGDRAAAPPARRWSSRARSPAAVSKSSGRTRRAGRTVALIGASGVGKSTLVNTSGRAPTCRRPARCARPTSGAGTPRPRASWCCFPAAACSSTRPGLRAVTLWVADDGFRRAFADIEALAAECRFHDCAHDREPGCAVQQAVARGELDAARVAHYRELDAELDRVHDPRRGTRACNTRVAGARAGLARGVQPQHRGRAVGDPCEREELAALAPPERMTVAADEQHGAVGGERRDREVVGSGVARRDRGRRAGSASRARRAPTDRGRRRRPTRRAARRAAPPPSRR